MEGPEVLLLHPSSTAQGFCHRGRARGGKQPRFQGFGTEHNAPSGWAPAQQKEMRYWGRGHRHQGTAQTNTEENCTQGQEEP